MVGVICHSLKEGELKNKCFLQLIEENKEKVEMTFHDFKVN